MQTRFEGSASIDALQRTVQDTQNMQVAKLTHLEGFVINGGNFNVADFTFVNRRREVPDEIIFVEVTDPSEVPSIIAGQLPNLLIFNEKIFVNNELRQYLGFSHFD